VDVRRIADGLWYWAAPHPRWRHGADWPEAVGCVYYEGPDAVVLIDPLLPRGEEEAFLEHLDRDDERAGLPVDVLLTAAWHERDAPILRGRYEAGDRIPSGIEVHPIEGAPEDQLAYFIRPHGALVVAEIFMGEAGGLRLCPSPALMDRAALDRSLESLLALPVERVLPGHGEPVLEHGLDAMRSALGEGLPAQAED
jgi:glyoxylase-like metal-dependent hydrolase (beta-lactamase superfamily II)